MCRGERLLELVALAARRGRFAAQGLRFLLRGLVRVRPRRLESLLERLGFLARGLDLAAQRVGLLARRGLGVARGCSRGVQRTLQGVDLLARGGVGAPQSVPGGGELLLEAGDLGAARRRRLLRRFRVRAQPLRRLARRVELAADDVELRLGGLEREGRGLGLARRAAEVRDLGVRRRLLALELLVARREGAAPLH